MLTGRTVTHTPNHIYITPNKELRLLKSKNSKLLPLTSVQRGVAFTFSLCHRHMDRISIVGQSIISPKAFFRVIDMPFKFIPEMADGCSNRPRSSISQWANCIALYLPLNIP